MSSKIGVGAGANLPLYGDAVTHIVGLEPAPRLASMARERAAGTGRPIEILDASADAIPLEGATVDTVVTTWTLCSIGQVQRALGEMRRVLKPEGRFLFVEHGAAPDPTVRRWQDRLTPAWKRLAGGCHLNRPIGQLIEEAGFRIEHLENGYMPGPKPLTYMYEGAARPR